MRKCILAFLFVLAGAISTFGQSTTVSGNVTDAGSQVWANGPIKFIFQPNPQFPTGPYTWSGGVLTPVVSSISGTLDGSGNYSVSVPSNSAITPAGSTWVLQITPDATSQGFSTPRTTITGATQTLNVTPPAIAINWNIPPGPAISAYADGEITGTLPKGAEYFNVTSGKTRVWNGSAWANQGTGGGGAGCPNGAAGDIQFTDGANCQNANGIFSGAIAKLNPVTGAMSFQANSLISFFAAASNSSMSFNSGTGGTSINSQGTVASEGALGVTFIADTGTLAETATAGGITRTGATFINDFVADACGVTPGSVTQRVVAITSDTILCADRQNRVVYNSASAVAVTLPTQGSAGFGGGYNTRLSNQMPGVVTVTPATGNINGNPTLVLNEGDDCFLTPSATGANWAADCNPPQLIAGANIGFTRGVHSLTINVTGLSPAPQNLTPTANLFATGYTQSTGAWNTGQVAGNSLNGAASTPAFILTGTPFAAGTGTTNFPFLYVDPSTATAVTGFSTNGEMFGINVPSSVTGRAFSIWNNGGASPTFSVAPAGSVVSSGSYTAAASSAMVISTRSAFRSPANGVFAIGDNAGTNTIQAKTIGVPTCAVTGAGSTGACAIATGSQDSTFQVTVTPGGTGIAALGTVTVTYNATSAFSGGHQADPVCILWNGTGTWNTRATLIGTTHSQTAPVINWDNNAVALTTAVTYQFSCHAFGI